MTHLWHTPPIWVIEDQIKWEMEAVRRGVERAREALDSQALGDGAVGSRLIRSVLPPFVQAIRAASLEAQEGIVGVEGTAGGRPNLWWWIIQLLEPETTAVIALKALLSLSPREFTFNRPVTGAAAHISNDLLLQLEFEDWEAEEKEKAKAEKAAAKAEQRDAVINNQFERYLRQTKRVDPRTYKKFTEKLGMRRERRWTKKEGIVYGSFLLSTLCASCPDWFSITTARVRGGNSETQVVFSEMARAVIGDAVEHNELQRPLLLPMTCPPADWRIAQ